MVTDKVGTISICTMKPFMIPRNFSHLTGMSIHEPLSIYFALSPASRAPTVGHDGGHWRGEGVKTTPDVQCMRTTHNEIQQGECMSAKWIENFQRCHTSKTNTFINFTPQNVVMVTTYMIIMCNYDMPRRVYLIRWKHHKLVFFNPWYSAGC